MEKQEKKKKKKNHILSRFSNEKLLLNNAFRKLFYALIFEDHHIYFFMFFFFLKAGLLEIFNVIIKFILNASRAFKYKESHLTNIYIYIYIPTCIAVFVGRAINVIKTRPSKFKI